MQSNLTWCLTSTSVGQKVTTYNIFGRMMQRTQPKHTTDDIVGRGGGVLIYRMRILTNTLQMDTIGEHGMIDTTDRCIIR